MGGISGRGLRPSPLALLFVVAVTSVPAGPQSVNRGTLSLRVEPECSISNFTSTSPDHDDGTLRGVTTFRYKLRTSGAGAAAIQLKLDQVRGLFKYTVNLPGSAAFSGNNVIPESGTLTVASFGPDAHTSKEGYTGTLSWELPYDVTASPSMALSISCH